MLDKSQNQETPLEGWKEIAAFLQRDESTARRWEREEGLAVRRHEHTRRSSVYAYPSELEAWRVGRKVETAKQPIAGRFPAVWATAAATAILLVTLIALSRSAALGPVAEAQSPGSGIRTTEVCQQCDGIGSVSPDGLSISETDWRNNAVGLRDFASGELRLITKKSAVSDPSQMSATYGHVFSPDGAFLAFGWNVRDRPTELRKVAVESSDGESLLLYSNDEFLKMQAVGWSAADEILVTGMRADWTTAVGLVPAEGGDLRIVKTIPSNQPTVRISPDGKWIAYDMASKEHAPRRDVYLLAADGSRESRVTSHEANEYVIGFTPGSEALLFASKRTGSYSLWAANILENGATAEPSLIQRDIGFILPLSITPDGAMFYARAIGAKDIFTAEIDWESGRIVAKPEIVQGLYQGANTNASWSPDGKSFVYIASESVSHDHVGSVVRLIVRSWPDGEEREIIPSGIRLSPFYAMQFSPDGKRVMLRARDMRGRWGIYSVVLSTGEAELLMREPQGKELRSKGWGKDGKTWFYEYRGEGVLYGMDPGATEGREIYSVSEFRQGGQIMYPRLSPQQDHVVFSRPGGQQIWVRPIEGDEPRKLYQAPEGAWAHSIVWAPEGDALVVVVGSRKSPQDGGVFRMPIDGSPAVKIELLGDRMSRPSIHPNGRTVIYDDGRPETRIWKMENYWLPEPESGATE